MWHPARNLGFLLSPFFTITTSPTTTTATALTFYIGLFCTYAHLNMSILNVLHTPTCRLFLIISNLREEQRVFKREVVASVGNVCTKQTHPSNGKKEVCLIKRGRGWNNLYPGDFVKSDQGHCNQVNIFLKNIGRQKKKKMHFAKLHCFSNDKCIQAVWILH